MTRPVVDVSALSPGTHLCRFYDDERDLVSGGAAFVAGGLASGARVLYVASGRPAEQVEVSFQVHGVAVEQAVRHGQLHVRTFEDVYGPGLLELGELEAGFRAEAALAKADGLPGLWIAAEMGDATRRFGSLARLLEWERIASRFQHETGTATVCQYDRRRLSGKVQDRVAAEHAGLAPAATAAPLAGFYTAPAGLRVVGELDLSNEDLFLEVVRARLDVQPHLRLDVAGLAFVDVGTLTGLVAAVLARPTCTLTLVNASPFLRRMLDLAGLLDRRVVVHP